jgi:hypothetical protein
MQSHSAQLRNIWLIPVESIMFGSATSRVEFIEKWVVEFTTARTALQAAHLPGANRGFELRDGSELK